MPGELSSRRRVGCSAQLGERPVADLYGTAVAPDDRRAQHRAGGIGQHQAVHLVGDADCLHVGQRLAGAAQRLAKLRGGRHQMPPPHLRVLLRPARPRCGNLQFGVGRGGLSHQPPALYLYQRRLDGRAAEVVAEQQTGHVSAPPPCHAGRPPGGARSKRAARPQRVRVAPPRVGRAGDADGAAPTRAAATVPTGRPPQTWPRHPPSGRGRDGYAPLLR